MGPERSGSECSGWKQRCGVAWTEPDVTPTVAKGTSQSVAPSRRSDDSSGHSGRLDGHATLRDGGRETADPWQPHREDGSAARPAMHRDGAAVGLRDPFGDREAQPRAGAVTRARARRIGAPEAIENVREIT